MTAPAHKYLGIPLPLLHLLWRTGHLALEVREMTSRWPHSRSWHTSISVFFPFTASIRFPHTGHFVLVRLSWRNEPSPVLIWRISSWEYPLMSFMNAPLFRLPFAMPDSFISQSAVSSGFFRSSGTSSRSCLALDVRQISLPRFSSRKLENSFSIISALVATVPQTAGLPQGLCHGLILCFHVRHRIFHGGEQGLPH